MNAFGDLSFCAVPLCVCAMEMAMANKSSLHLWGWKSHKTNWPMRIGWRRMQTNPRTHKHKKKSVVARNPTYLWMKLNSYRIRICHSVLSTTFFFANILNSDATSSERFYHKKNIFFYCDVLNVELEIDISHFSIVSYFYYSIGG